jgi:hypothetical protein
MCVLQPWPEGRSSVCLRHLSYPFASGTGSWPFLTSMLAYLYHFGRANQCYFTASQYEKNNGLMFMHSTPGVPVATLVFV